LEGYIFRLGGEQVSRVVRLRPPVLLVFINGGAMVEKLGDIVSQFDELLIEPCFERSHG